MSEPSEKRVVLIPIDISREALARLEEQEKTRGLKPAGFWLDAAGTAEHPEGVLWLIYESADAEGRDSFPDTVSMRGGIYVDRDAAMKKSDS